MHAPDQFMIYHLHEWDTEKLKWKKKPVGLQGEALMVGAGIPTSVDRAYVAAQCAQLGAQYRVGLWLAPASNFFFIDLDDDAVDANGNLTPLAAQIAAPFIHAGCYFEPSSSGRGAHVIGRCSVALPEHANSRKRVHPHEFYTRDRGCVLTTGNWHGDWNVDAGALLPAMLAEYFPPRIASDTLVALGDGPRKEWRGPVDDDDLIRKMLGAAGSAAARMQGKVSLAKLWAGECEHNSESDMALAAHLAFWTGADVERTERLMMRSGIKRDKWFEMRRDVTYLRQTVINCCVSTANVYQEPIRLDTASLLLGTPKPIVTPPVLQPLAAMSVDSDGVIQDATVVQDWWAVTDDAVKRINEAGTVRELYDVVFPSISAGGFPPVHANTLVQTSLRKLDSMGAKQAIVTVRSLLSPPRDLTAVALENSKPEWAVPLVFVLSTDRYFNTATGKDMSATGIRNAYTRYMPMRHTGARDDPVTRLMDSWGIETVDELEYRPGQDAIFYHGGKMLANRFLPSTMPTPALGSDECTTCIEMFTRHLADITNRRADVYAALLGWIAHNVQHPGIKIRWAPIIKGIGGDGKSIIGELMFAAMGDANVKITSPSTISNSGGFTDWAMGACVNLIEEINLEGKERRKLYNVMKTILADGRINPNRKGKSSTETYVNTMNHAAFTNYEDATPVENGDRRWCVIFAPWGTLDEALRVKGLTHTDGLSDYFGRINASFKAEPGAWRSWLCNIDLSSFNPNGRAPTTDERETMISSSEDFVAQTIRDCLERGTVGVTQDVFCSWSLMGFVQREMNERPDVKSWNRVLTDLGYRQAKPVWWMGKTRRAWSKFPMTKEQIQERLNATLQPVVSGKVG